MTIKMPADLSISEKKAYRAIVKALQARGLDPSSRAILIEELVRQESRLSDLRTNENEAGNPLKMASTRALNVATAERRRIYQALFQGARDAEPIATRAEIVAADRQSEADEAWRDQIWTAAERPRRRPPIGEAELMRRFGEPSWNALLYASPEQQAEGERTIDASHRNQGRPSRLKPQE